MNSMRTMTMVLNQATPYKLINNCNILLVFYTLFPAIHDPPTSIHSIYMCLFTPLLDTLSLSTYYYYIEVASSMLLHLPKKKTFSWHFISQKVVHFYAHFIIHSLIHLILEKLLGYCLLNY